MKKGKANPIGGALFERVNQASGGVAGGVVAGLGDAGRAASVDVGKGIAKLPGEMVDTVMGGKGDDGEAGTKESGSDAGSGSGQVGAGSQLMDLVEEERKKRQVLIRQHQMVLEQYREQHQRTKMEEEGRRQEEAEAKEEHKKIEIRQLERKKKQEALAVTQARQQRSGTREGIKTKF